MQISLGLGVTYTDSQGNSFPAIISKIHDVLTGLVDLVVFVSIELGYRNDQVNVLFSLLPANNTWGNLS